MPVSRRELARLAYAAALVRPIGATRVDARLIVRVRVMLDQGVHGAKGLDASEVARFSTYQDKAERDFAISGIAFELECTEGAFLRKQGYSEIPSRFMDARAINLFVTDSLGYDVDRERTGGCSTGPTRAGTRFAADPFYKTFLGLSQAGEMTLEHEYAHHFTLDTSKRPTATGNVWADLRNDYWLWRQRRGARIPEFRVCTKAVWAMPA